MGAGASRSEAVCSRVRRQTKVKTDAHGHLRTGRGIDTERRVGHWEDGVRPTSGSGSTFIRRVRLLCVLRRGEHDGCGQGSMGRFTGRIPVDSDDGQDLLDQGWEATKPRITNWTRESRTPSLAYRNTETGARAVLHRGPDSYRYKWRAAILVDGYPVWSRGFETKQATVFRDTLRDRPTPS